MSDPSDKFASQSFSAPDGLPRLGAGFSTRRHPGDDPAALNRIDNAPLVSIEGLTIAFPDERGERLVPVVRDASFGIDRHEVVGLVGESGSGKTQTALAILGLTRPPGRVLAGRIRIGGEDVVGLDEEQLRAIRGRRVTMIFQSPRTSLNPLMTVGEQIGRIYQRRRGLDRRAARTATLAMLRRVGIAGPERVVRSYPHQLSGGMAQRVLIGMMVACEPELLIADEPTTGLDVTIQAQIFELIQEIQAQTRMSVLLITHDLGVVAEVCHRVVVMQAGRVVEIAPVDALFARPLHPYTRRLLGSILRPDRPPDAVAERTAAADAVQFEVGGRCYEAVVVDAWRARGVGRPELIEIAAGHWVLGHAVAEPARVPA
jgi:peptide/nickel transport system ATP-binding protein